MKILKKALIYDISNMAYVIADTGEPLNHTLHKVRDICQDGNIDRVSRVLGLAYSCILTVLQPLLEPSCINMEKDNSVRVHDYALNLRNEGIPRHLLTAERKLRIKETAHEYMVAMVLADWLGITLPAAADVWKYRAEEALEALAGMVAEILAGANGRAAFRRTLSPF